MHGDNEPPSPREGERSGINSDSSTSPTHGSQVVAFVAGQELVHKGGEVEQLRLEKKRLQRELRRERELHLRNVKCMSDMFEATVQSLQSSRQELADLQLRYARLEAAYNMHLSKSSHSGPQLRKLSFQ